MSAKTATQIKKEVAALTKMKPKVLHHSAFGDDHHAAIDAQIHVLSQGLTEDEIWDEYGEDTGTADNVRGAALDAATWAEGGSEDKPSDSWKELVR